MSIIVNNKSATRINAKFILEASSGLSCLYDCEGDEVWVPNSVCSFNPDTEELDIQDWFYEQLCDEGKL